MTKRSKAYRAAAEKIQSGILYTPAEAVRLAKETSVTKFDSTVDVALPGSWSSPRVSVLSRLSTPALTRLAATT